MEIWCLASALPASAFCSLLETWVMEATMISEGLLPWLICSSCSLYFDASIVKDRNVYFKLFVQSKSGDLEITADNGIDNYADPTTHSENNYFPEEEQMHDGEESDEDEDDDDDSAQQGSSGSGDDDDDGSDYNEDTGDESEDCEEEEEDCDDTTSEDYKDDDESLKMKTVEDVSKVRGERNRADQISRGEAVLQEGGQPSFTTEGPSLSESESARFQASIQDVANLLQEGGQPSFTTQVPPLSESESARFQASIQALANLLRRQRSLLENSCTLILALHSWHLSQGYVGRALVSVHQEGGQPLLAIQGPPLPQLESPVTQASLQALATEQRSQRIFLEELRGMIQDMNSWHLSQGHLGSALVSVHQQPLLASEGPPPSQSQSESATFLYLLDVLVTDIRSLAMYIVGHS